MWNLVLAKLGFDGDSVYFQGAYEGRCLHTQCLTLSLPTSRWNINLVSLGKYSIAPLLSFVLFLHPSTSSPSLGLLWRELRPYVQVTHRGNVKRREKAKNFFPPWPDDSWCFADPSSLTTRTPFYKGRTVKFLILLWKSWHDWIPFQLHFSDSLSPCIYRRLESNHRDFQISESFPMICGSSTLNIRYLRVGMFGAERVCHTWTFLQIFHGLKEHCCSPAPLPWCELEQTGVAVTPARVINTFSS